MNVNFEINLLRQRCEALEKQAEAMKAAIDALAQVRTKKAKPEPEAVE